MLPLLKIFNFSMLLTDTRGDPRGFTSEKPKKSLPGHITCREGQARQNASNFDNYVCPSKGRSVIRRSEWQTLDRMLLT